MMMISKTTLVDAPAAVQSRLQGNTEISGVHAHAAVRMHAVPVKGFFWAYCPKTKTRHSQRSKVAT